MKTVINYSVEQKTKARIQKLADNTHRNPGKVIDWIVELIWNKQHPEGDQQEPPRAAEN